MPLGAQFVQFYLEFLAEHLQRAGGGVAQDVRNPHKCRFVVLDDAAQRRDGHFAVRKGIQGVDGLVRGNAGRQMDEYFYLVGCIVVDALDLDLALFVGFQYGFDERRSGSAERYLVDH